MTAPLSLELGKRLPQAGRTCSPANAAATPRRSRTLFSCSWRLLPRRMIAMLLDPITNNAGQITVFADIKEILLV
jgi:hypothetical protein